MDQLDKLLTYLEENIDLEHVKNVEKLHVDTLNYEKVPFLPLVTLFPIDHEYTSYPYREAYENPEKMLFNELLWSFSSIYNSVKTKDYFALHIRSNHGIGIVPSLFGAKCKIINDNMPWIEHFEDMMDIKKIILKGIPDFGTGLGGKVISTHKFYLDKLKEYPKCYEAIHVSQPDMQGPFDIAHLLIGSNIFYQVYDNPDILHQLLEIITSTYIGFRKQIEPFLTDNAGNNMVYVHGSIYGGKVVLKDDTAAINLSRDMYNEFSKLYNDRILEAFGGGTIHHCGQERDWHFDSFCSRWLKGINYGNPEMHDLDKTYSYWKEKKVPLLWWGYNQTNEFLDTIYKLKISSGVSLATKVDDINQAGEILKKHIEMTGLL